MESPRIVVLEQDVVNQIAAGEVVERPASVVKELVENALDAAARRVEVEVREGGRRLIRVVDDGWGMTPVELPLSLERHATSKLRRVDDLCEIRSMGFRGEALPSIASVTRFCISSRAAPGGGEGAKLQVEGGAAGELEPVGRKRGTTVEVEDLFFNTPARLKFLKSAATEAAQISDTVSRLALASPEVHFVLVQDGRRVLDLAPCADRLERCRAVLTRSARTLFRGALEEGEERIEACMAPPAETLRTARQLTILVNRRYVRDRSLLQAVVAGFGQLLERGRFPVAVLYLDLAPGTLDVNVHPQKVEVRFEDPRRVFGLVRRCVEQTLAGSPWLAAGSGCEAPAAREYALDVDRGGYEEHKRRIMEATRRFWAGAAHQAAAAEGARDAYGPALQPGQGAQLSPAEGEPAGGGRPQYFSALRVVGEALGLFIVCEGEGELVLIDQHAAHERVTFEKLRRGLRGGRVPGQRLLVPETVELDASLAALAGERAGELEELGFELDPFGGGSWAIRTVPALLRGAEPGALLRDVLEELGSGGQGVVQEARERVLSRMACHGSVRAGRNLEHEEMAALLRALDLVDFSASCPHGRPVMIRLSRRDLEHRLKR